MYGFLEGTGDPQVSHRQDQVLAPAYALGNLCSGKLSGRGMAAMALLCGPDPLDDANRTNMGEREGIFRAAQGIQSHPPFPTPYCAPF